MSDHSPFEPNRREPALGGNTNPDLTGDEPYLSFDLLLPGVRDEIGELDRETRIQALAKVRTAPDAAVPILTQLLRTSPEPRTRQRCAAMLGQIRNTKAVSALLDALASEDPVLRKIIAWALGQIGDLSAAPALRGLARHDADHRVRTAAITSLGELGDIEAVELLLEVEAEASPIASAATGALKLIRARCPVQVLAAQLLSENERLRAWAGQHFLNRRDDSGWTSDDIRFVEKLIGVEQPRGVRHRAVGILGTIAHEQSQTILLNLVGDPDEKMSAAAIVALDWNQVHDAAERLFQRFDEALDDSDERPNYHLCSALLEVFRHLDRPGVDEFLLERLRTGRVWGIVDVLRERNDPRTPAAIARTLTELADPSIREKIVQELAYNDWSAPEITALLRHTLHHSSDEAQRHAMLWCVLHHPELLPDLVEALNDDPSIEVRREIAYIMHDFGDSPEVEATLRRILTQDSDDILRANAAYSLAVSGADDGPEILKRTLESCQEEDAWLSLVRASEVFSDEDGPRLEYLRQIYQMAPYSSVRRDVLEEWELPDLPGGVEFIIQALEQDPSPEVRYSAAWALHRDTLTQNTAVLHALIAALDDTAAVQLYSEDPTTTQVCQMAAQALGRFNSPEALAALEDWRRRTSDENS